MMNKFKLDEIGGSYTQAKFFNSVVKNCTRKGHFVINHVDEPFLTKEAINFSVKKLAIEKIKYSLILLNASVEL